MKSFIRIGLTALPPHSLLLPEARFAHLCWWPRCAFPSEPFGFHTMSSKDLEARVSCTVGGSFSCRYSNTEHTLIISHESIHIILDTPRASLHSPLRYSVTPLRPVSTLFLRQGLSLKLGSSVQLEWTASEPPTGLPASAAQQPK